VFTRRVTGSFGVAVTAATLLVFSPGFFGEHGARTADFDAPLTFFVTIALQLIFFCVHRARPTIRSMVLIGALVAAGALTKSIAAFIPLAGVAVYLVGVGRLKRVVSLAPRYAIAISTSILPLLTFFVLREAAGPGYLAAMIHNDVAGRFGENLIAEQSPLLYVTNLSIGWFVAGPVLLAAPLMIGQMSGRTKLAFVYALSIVGCSLFVYTAASNRALQYALPLFPWLAIVAALTLRQLVCMIADGWTDGRRREAITLGPLLGVSGAYLLWQSLDWRYHRFPERDFYPQSSYGDLFAALAARGVTSFTVVDPGNIHLGTPGYAPLLRWNRLIWQQRGLAIDHQFKQPVVTRAPLATCQPTIASRWSGPGLERIGSCAVLWNSPAMRSPADPSGT
jgi:hypothetical protein